MVLVYYWNEKIGFSFKCHQGFRFFTLIASTNCKVIFVQDKLSEVYESLGTFYCTNTGTLVIENKDRRVCCRFVIFSPVWRGVRQLRTYFGLF